MTVSPAFTISPFLTEMSNPFGTNTSTLDENFISPKRSPIGRVSPTAALQTVLLASKPAPV